MRGGGEVRHRGAYLQRRPHAARRAAAGILGPAQGTVQRFNCFPWQACSGWPGLPAGRMAAGDAGRARASRPASRMGLMVLGKVVWVSLSSR